MTAVLLSTFSQIVYTSPWCWRKSKTWTAKIKFNTAIKGIRQLHPGDQGKCQRTGRQRTKVMKRWAAINNFDLFQCVHARINFPALRGWFGFAPFPPLTLQSSENRTKQNHFRIYVCRVTTCFLLLITSEVKCKRKQTKLRLLPAPILSFCFPSHTAHSCWVPLHNPRVAEERFRSFPALLACLPAHFIFPN